MMPGRRARLSRRHERFEWLDRCRDEANRRGTVVLRVVGDGRRLALITPGGDVAMLDFLAIGRLRRALLLGVEELRLPPAECADRQVTLPQQNSA